MQDFLVGTCRAVGLLAQNVRIRDKAFAHLAETLMRGELSAPSWRAPVFPENDDKTFLQFLGVGNSINYCFTDFKTHGKFDTNFVFPDGSKRVVYGAFAMWACLKRALNNGIPVLSARFLAEGLDEETYDQIFVPVTTPLPMRESRIQNLRATGEALLRWYDGAFSNLFDRADFQVFRDDGNGIIQRLARHFLSYSRDMARYCGLSTPIPFHKRARLLALMYEGRARASEGCLPCLQDPGNIGPVADYDVPKALRAVGVLRYSPHLSRLVDDGIPIHHGNVYEVEIRAQTVNAMDALCAAINRLRERAQPITQIELDYAVWSAGREARGKHHYTKTTAY
ncbi:MAG: hypothetical protein A2806_01355 [Candidatus Terrybacteria bacterium RIFCSPHIGHO2_01_FULL_48_17]|uniref:Queuosine 5'-phosphate N-glycosylase/hydrolase n=1 Tax=Candidatus Terrybacteria bacterium RIFCSPHIGHO2_01_FULL_48_17 TaxID=1802362 RepID=A0A1G2PHA5_9BACT|nr:MAG: hypothetical protein A2806_01355 [Candidatus Terrybacteria bacterium RIFCSPHIGHO2_01_FULL_48_17]